MKDTWKGGVTGGTGTADQRVKKSEPRKNSQNGAEPIKRAKAQNTKKTG